jgi:hypothetical protein
MTRTDVGTSVALGLGLMASAFAMTPAHAADSIDFKLIRSAGLPAACAPKATATAHLATVGFAEHLTLGVSGFKPGTKFDVFVIQVPNKPFGIAWYLGDIANGQTHTFVSRLNDETFAVAVGPAAAPIPHGARDASTNPTFAPVQTFHVGVWFNSVADGAANGCAGGPTPFNGDHTAGIQVLNTGQFDDAHGPLRRIE